MNAALRTTSEGGCAGLGPRVLHLIYHLERGGSEAQCARVATALTREGQTHRVAVAVRRGVLVPEVESVCGPLFEWRIRRIRSLRMPGRVLRLARWMKENRFDVVHAWDMDAILFGTPAARMAGIPFITSRRDMGGIYPAWKRALRDRAERGAAAIVVNANAIRVRLAAHTGRRPPIHVIPNLVPLPDLEDRGSRQDGFCIGVVARLVADKGIEDFLRALARVREQDAEVSAVIAGDGPERSRLETMTADVELSGAVRFLGDVRDVPGLLRSVDIGVLPSRIEEGLSNAIMEYMAAALPVVATDGGGTPELVRDGRTGLLVRSRDPRALAGALLTLRADPALARAMGMRGRQRMETEYSYRSVLHRFDSLYRSVANAKRTDKKRN